MKRARLRGFFLLSLFVNGENRCVYVGVFNIASIACTLAVTWVASASLLFPDQAFNFCVFVFAPMDQLCIGLAPKIRSFLEVPLFVGSIMLGAGAIWIPAFGILTTVTLRYCFAIHVSASDTQQFQRIGMLTTSDEPWRAPKHGMARNLMETT